MLKSKNNLSINIIINQIEGTGRIKGYPLIKQTQINSWLSLKSMSMT